MKRYYSLFALKSFIIGLILSSLLMMPFHGQALSIDSARDCDDNAMIQCGALTTSELASKYQASGVGPVYARFGITGAEVASMNGSNTDAFTTRTGMVTKTGKVEVDGKVVATDAITAGRQNMAGSTQESSGGITFYQRPPSVSFAATSLPAFVVMENGKFSFAIIASCGNPVKATPTAPPVTTTNVPKPVPTPKPTPTPTPTPTPAPTPTTTPVQQPTTITITNTNTQSQSQAQAQGGMGGGTPTTSPTASATATTPTTNAQAQATAPASTSTPATASSSKEATVIPNTGPGNVAALSGVTTVLATAGHAIMRRRKTI